MQTTNIFSKYYSRKAKSKKGFTLVEAVASVIILAIVCVGVLNAVAFSREMVFSNNSREKASDKAQLVADEIVAAATGVDPSDPAGNPEGIIQSNVDAIANNAAAGTTNIQTDAIGKVNRVAAFSTPTNDNELVQYILTKVVDSTDVEHDTDVRVSGIHQKATVHDATLVGWDIKVRVYYKMVGSGDYRVVDVSAFAPRDINVY